MALIAAGCRRPEQKIVPQVTPVEYLVPGVSNYYSSVFCQGNYNFGILVKTREGRPVKIDGNELHPTTKGSVSALVQASLYSLYDPDRFRKPKIQGRDVILEQALTAAEKLIKDSNQKSAFIIEEHCSPAFGNLISKFSKLFPNVEFVILPALPDNFAIQKVNKELYGFDGKIVPDLSKADLVLSVGSDILGTNIFSPFFTHALFNRDEENQAELLTAESILTQTGMASNERFVIGINEYEQFLAELSINILRESADKTEQSYLNFLKQMFPNENHAKAKKIASRLIDANNQGKKVCILAGENLSETSIVMTTVLNEVLSAVGKNVIFDFKNVLPKSEDKSAEIENFYTKLSQKYYSSVFFLNSNPFYSNRRLKQAVQYIPVQNRFSLSTYEDETASECGISIPLAHYLESWGDSESFDGTKSIQQPVIANLSKNSVSIADFLLKIAKSINANSFPGVDNYYTYIRKIWNIGDLDTWEKILRDGFVNPEKSSNEKYSFNIKNSEKLISSRKIIKTESPTLFITPSATQFDGKEANNAWLAELPDPVTKQAWGNCFAIGSQTAKQFNLQTNDLIKVSSGSESVVLPIIIIEGIAKKLIHSNLGFGRTKGGNILTNVGANLYNFIDSKTNLYVIHNIKIEKQNKKEKTAPFQDDKVLVHERLISNLKGKAELKEQISIYPKYEYKSHRWAMVIDLSKCTACGSCMISCQSENNIPIVGKEEIIHSRMMNWLRIDSFEIKENDKIKYVNFPILCQHCETAPCESVCPVAATSHSPEGINEMTYNRCVGARFCMINCPYKVRRFNFKNYNADIKKPMENMLNPDVTVRMQGIAEKCTFCIQKINEARYKMKDKGLNRIPDGEVKTACQLACPSGAIVFGDINDKNSKISKIIKKGKTFKLLDELNTKPSVSYKTRQ